MNGSHTNWLLAGALAASLAWNAKGALRAPVEPLPQSPAQDCSAMIDVVGLQLSPVQKRALEDWSKSACASSCQIDSQAESKWRELQAALRDPSVGAPTLRELAAEVSRLRADSLESCVDSIVEVRRVLTKEQLAALMACCGSCSISESAGDIRYLGYAK